MADDPQAKVPPKLNLASAGETRPEAPILQPIKSENIYVGYSLAKIFSAILFVYMVLALSSVWYSECKMLSKLDSLSQGLAIAEMKAAAAETNTPVESASPLATQSPVQTAPATKTPNQPKVTKDEVELIMKSVGERYRETRAMTVDFHKTVVVNVLFPILTALLGYIFANREKNEPNQARS
jgi:hypothetical protein